MIHGKLLCIVGCLATVVACADASAPAPAAGRSSPAPAAVQAAPAPITQEALLERQAQHDPSLFVLDVRTPEEFAAGHVPGAVNVPYDQVASRLQEIPKDKDVVLYCRSGRRAALAADALAASGYTRLSHLQGDMEAWVRDGRPVEAAAGK